jgi:hypothetical protein
MIIDARSPDVARSPDERSPEGYRAERLRAELALDPLVARLDVEVTIVGDLVVLRGEVETLERKRRVVEVVGQLVPDLAVDDGVRVRALREPEREILS